MMHLSPCKVPSLAFLSAIGALVLLLVAADPMTQPSVRRCTAASASAAKVAEHAAAALRTAMGDVPGLPPVDAATVGVSRARAAACLQSDLADDAPASESLLLDPTSEAQGLPEVSATRATYVSVLTEQNATGRENEWMLLDLIEARRPQQHAPSALGHLL